MTAPTAPKNAVLARRTGNPDMIPEYFKNNEYAQRTLYLLAYVIEDFEHISKLANGEYRDDELFKIRTEEEYANKKVSEIRLLEKYIEGWEQELRDLKLVFKYFPYIDARNFVSSPNEIINLGKFIKGESETGKTSTIIRNSGSYRNNAQWKELSHLLISLGRADIPALTKMGFLTDHMPQGYQNPVDMKEHFLWYETKEAEKSKKIARSASVQYNAPKSSSQDIIVKPSKDKVTGLEKSFVASITGFIVGLPITALAITDVISLSPAVGIGLIGSSFAILPVYGLVTQLRDFKNRDTVRGEVISTQKVAVSEISAGENEINSMLSELDAIVSSLHPATPQNIIQEVLEITRQTKILYQSEFVDAQTKAEIDSLMRNKFISSISLFNQAVPFAVETGEQEWIESTFLRQISQMKKEVSHLMKVVLEQKKEAMQIQSMYLESEVTSETKLNLNKER